MSIEYSGTGDPARSMELLWGVQDKPRRGPKPKLTVARITAAAVAIADAEGLDVLTMRKVGDALGVTAMSLYNYVPGKGELLDLMLDSVYAELATGDDERVAVGAEPAPGGAGTAPGAAGDWRTRLERVARDNRALYLRHPWLLRVASSRPVLGPHTIAKYERELGAVDGLGLTDIEMDLLVQLVNDYVHGAVRGAVEDAQALGSTGITDQEWWEANGPLLERVFDAERFPLAARVGSASGEEYQAAHDPSRAFEFGLRVLLDGVAATLPGTPGPR
ncbi:TetR/AcrR family transcriptional regulator [Longispora fulva]|uniref:AcrR family transcriptional regulator n=1 Tax=Longispora fulva TaxID=619741 RepID=A0A8J7GUZ9_9ACTN|nr:TetR/AcrR family transcriptional regulator C-terminal domain-containing protein [Longispora fulva]MBG6137911.1 AcrR family transcriptional regulator [Longispora fulva]